MIRCSEKSQFPSGLLNNSASQSNCDIWIRGFNKAGYTGPRGWNFRSVITRGPFSLPPCLSWSFFLLLLLLLLFQFVFLFIFVFFSSHFDAHPLWMRTKSDKTMRNDGIKFPCMLTGKRLWMSMHRNIKSYDLWPFLYKDNSTFSFMHYFSII